MTVYFFSFINIIHVFTLFIHMAVPCMFTLFTFSHFIIYKRKRWSRQSVLLTGLLELPPLDSSRLTLQFMDHVVAPLCVVVILPCAE